MLNSPEELPDVTEMSTTLDDIRDTPECEAMLITARDIEALDAVNNNWAYSSIMS